MFSVIIPLYNKELSVKNTIKSVLNQTYGNFEIIIVNDGSTDGSLKVVQSIEDARIRIIDKPNGGVSSARNRGIEEAKYEWIAFLDGDDIWKESHLDTLQSLIKQFPEDKVFCTSYIRSNQVMPANTEGSISIIADYFQEAHTLFFWTSVACIQRSVLQKVGVFNENLNRGEDLELWTRIGREYQFVKSNLVTAIYRIEAENRSDAKLSLEKSRAFLYDFDESSSRTETKYYKKQIINSLKSLLVKRDFRNFFRLKNKHKHHITYIDILFSLKKS